VRVRVLRRLCAVCQGKGRLLARYLPYEDGTPSHDTFGRLLRLIKPEQFGAVLADLARRVTAGSAGHVAIDGKTVRGSADVARGVRALHLLHAFATDVGLCIGQVAVGGKSNEITALPELLRLLDLRGRDVTMDAMHTQRASAKLLHEAGAHDVMALKGNQPTLLDDVRTALGDPLMPVLEHEETNIGHGRVETRAARVSTDVAVLAHHCWPGLAAVGRKAAPAPASGPVRQRRKASSTCLHTPIRPSACLPSRGHWAEAVKVLPAKPVEYGRRALRTTCTGFST